jgi:cobalt-zinc-cadmium resistance protein CzcA
LIYSAIPLSAIGGIFFFKRNAFQYQRRNWIYALFGVAVLNGLVLIAEFNSIRKSNADLKTLF